MMRLSTLAAAALFVAAAAHAQNGEAIAVQETQVGTVNVGTDAKDVASQRYIPQHGYYRVPPRGLGKTIGRQPGPVGIAPPIVGEKRRFPRRK